jgi:hypothetical protein
MTPSTPALPLQALSGSGRRLRAPSTSLSAQGMIQVSASGSATQVFRGRARRLLRPTNDDGIAVAGRWRSWWQSTSPTPYKSSSGAYDIKPRAVGPAHHPGDAADPPLPARQVSAWQRDRRLKMGEHESRYNPVYMHGEARPPGLDL